MGRLRLGRILIAALAAEVGAVLVLVVLVAALGPAEPAAAQAYAERLGYWVGPLAGLGFCLLGGYWVARGAVTDRIVNGAALGFTVALLDVGILVVSGAAFAPIFVVSNLGRVLAGTAGGWMASRGAAA